MRIKRLYKNIVLCGVGLLVFIMSAYAQPKADFSLSSSSGCAPFSVKCIDRSTGNPVVWEWKNSQNPANVITLQNPEFVFYTPGTYFISLKVIDANGNSSPELTQTINVTAEPSVAFTADKTTGCTPLEVNFTDNSTTPSGIITKWEWDFGDGYTSTDKNPVHKYTLAGSFNVTLKVSTTSGACTKTETKTQYITTTQGADGDFSYTIAAGSCTTPIKVVFSNTSSATTGFSWDFGDGSPPSTDKNPFHDYIKGGAYNVTLRVQGGQGCNSVIAKTIQLPTGALAVAFNTPASICENEPVQFTNNFAYPPDNLQWDFGNGVTSVNANPPPQTYAAGTYTVTLTATSGACSGSYTKQITVAPKVNATINVSTNGSCAPPLTVTFSTVPAVGTYEWDFGDGSPVSTQPNPTHTYTKEGSFTVKLKAGNGNCVSVITTTLPVVIAKPIVGVKNLPFKGCIPQTITFEPDIVSPTPVASYQWTIGNNLFTSTLQKPVFTFTTAGKYDVRLKIRTTDGCDAEFYLKDAIKVGTKPTANFNVNPTVICASDIVKPQDASTGNPLDEWGWDFLGQGSYNVFGQNPQYKYNDTGTYNIRMYVESNGCRDTSLPKSITIKPPVAIPDYDRDCQNFNAIRFINKSKYDPTDASNTWLWDFGDNTTDAGFEPAGFKIFPAVTVPTVFNVKLKATTSSCSDENTIPITIYPGAPTLTFNANNKCANDPVTFTITNIDQSKIQSITWDFGDGTAPVAGTDITLTHTYTKPGTYNPVVKAVFTFASNCQLVITPAAPLVVQGPIADFTFPAGKRCKDSTVVFTSTTKDDGTNPITSLLWDYGDGTSDASGIHTYNKMTNVYQSYTVRLTATDRKGCVSIKDSVLIFTAPSADFTVNDTITCRQKPLQFINLSNAYKPLFEWDFGDNSPISNDFNPVHSYTTNLNTLTIKLKVTDANGCTAFIEKNNFVKIDNPLVDFTINDTISLCPPLQAVFTLTASGYEKILWNFGTNEGVSNNPNPKHFYNNPGVFNPSVTVTSKGGCSSTVSKKVEVLGANGTLAGTPDIGCVPMDVSFNLNAYGKIDNYVWNFDDGNVDTNRTISLLHRYTDLGNFNPVVIIISDSTCKKIVRTSPVKILGAKVSFKPNLKKLCTNDVLQVTNTIRSNDPIRSYLWDFGDPGSPDNTSTLPNATHNYLKPGTYDVSLKVITDFGCTSDSTMKQLIRITEKPDVSIKGPDDLCQRDSVLFKMVVNNNPDTLQFTKWLWDFGNGKKDTMKTPAPVVYSQPGNYTVRLIARDIYGCTDTSAAVFSIKPGPTVDAGQNRTTLPGNPVQLNGIGSNDIVRWLWKPSNGLDRTDIPNPTATITNKQVYTATVTNTLGCTASDSVVIELLCGKEYYFMANTFTPDGDGVNDWFYPQGRAVVNIKSMRIYNRWGQLVFEKREVPINVPTAGWNGTVQGRALSPDIYVYVIEVICGGQIVPLKGNVMLAK